MIDMAMDTLKLVVTNKLFLNPVKAYGLMALGILVAAAIMVIFAYFNVPLWLSGAVAGFAGGMLMPILFKDIKFA